MRRRTLLAGLAGGTAMLAGCNTTALGDASPRDVHNPTGRATVRPLDEPLVRHGLTSDSDQYIHARLFQPGASLPVTERQDAAWFSETVDGLSAGQFAIVTQLRTATTAPAYFWPADARWTDGTVRIELERKAGSTDSDADEVVGVALAAFEYDGDTPNSVDIVFPSGATLSVGDRK